MRDSNELFIRVNALFDSEANGVQMYLVKKNEGEYSTFLVNLREDVHSSLIESAKNGLLTSFDCTVDGDIEKKKIFDFSNYDDRENTIVLYDLEEQFEIINQIISPAINQNAQTFSVSDHGYNNLFGYIFQIGTDESRIIIFTKHMPVSLFKAQTQFLMISSDHDFISLDKDVLRVHFKPTFIYFNSELYFFDFSIIEKFFGVSEVLLRGAKNCVTEINSQGLVEDTDNLLDKYANQFSRRLLRISKNGKVLGKVSSKALCDFVKANPKLKGIIKLSDSEDKIALQTKTDVKNLIVLLEDNYLSSGLTNEIYEALRKNEI